MMEQTGDKFIPNQAGNQFSNLDQMFDTPQVNAVALKEYPREVAVIITDKVGDEERANDFATTRETLHRILSKSEDTLDDLLYIAKQSEHPRTFEVAGQLIKTVADVADQLVKLHKTMRELDKAEINPRDAALNQGASIDTQNNIVFTGTPAELLAALKQQREKEAVMKDIN